MASTGPSTRILMVIPVAAHTHSNPADKGLPIDLMKDPG